MPQRPFRIIYEAEWNDIACVDYPLTPEKYVAESIEPLVNTQVDTLFYNLCSSDAFCCGMESGELLCDAFDPVADAWVWRYRENVKKMLEAGANPPDIACRYGHDLGLKVIPVVRMNDMHDMFFKYEVSRFKLQNPHLLLGYGKYVDWEKGYDGYPDKTAIESFTWGGFDYAHEEVREHRLAIIEEFITRWDNDGVSLDFDRSPWLFGERGNRDNTKLITELIRRVRHLLDQAGAQRGRRQYLHVRIIPPIDACVELGMDVPTWVNEGLVDAITPGCGYMSFSQNLSPWLDLVDGKPCWVYPSNNHWKPVEVARAWAKLMWQRGAHGLYLFNWGHLLHSHENDVSPRVTRPGTLWFDELPPDYYQILHEMGDPKTLTFRNDVYDLESIAHEKLEGQAGWNLRQSRGLHDVALPIELAPGRHVLQFGFADDLDAAGQRGMSANVTLRMKVHNYTQRDEFDVFINANRLPPKTRTTRASFIMDNWTWISFPIGPDFLHLGQNELAVNVKQTNPAIEAHPRLDNVQLIVNYQ